MGITKSQLQAELASLESQREQAVAQVCQIDGACRVCRKLIGDLERAEDQERAKAAEGPTPPPEG